MGYAEEKNTIINVDKKLFNQIKNWVGNSKKIFVNEKLSKLVKDWKRKLTDALITKIRWKQ